MRHFTWLDTSALFLSTCKLSIIWLHLANRRGHKKSITWRYAEHSDVTNVTSAGYNDVNAIVSASLFLSDHTMQSNALHMTLNPLIKYICLVNILCLSYFWSCPKEYPIRLPYSWNVRKHKYLIRIVYASTLCYPLIGWTRKNNGRSGEQVDK